MKVLITGQNSYAGTQFAARVAYLKKDWEVNFVSVRDDNWKKENFSVYDAIYHVAGIVHLKEKSANESLYFRVNRDLSYQLAKKAKLEGVKSFIFLSSMAVYGLIGYIGEDTVISKATHENPNTYYGKSKLEAEELLETLTSETFKVCSLRIPMIYGHKSPGNYKLLSKMAKKIPLFPKINNKRSLVFIDHLSDIVIYLISNNNSGLYLIKNPEDIDTLKMVKEIAKKHNKKIYNSFILGFIIKKVGNNFIITRKMFGNIFYDPKDCSIQGFIYRPLTFEESISLAEGVKLTKKL